MRRRWLVTVLALLTVVAASTPASGRQTQHVVRQWVNTWTSMPQLTEPGNMPPAAFVRDGVVLPDTTLRQTVRFSVGGDRIRLRFSNAFGGAPLPITSVSIAAPLGGKAGVGEIEPGSARAVTFRGKPGAVVPAGALVVSDPLDFSVQARQNVTVTAYFAQGQASTSITSHPGSRTTSQLLAGDHVADKDLPGATPVDHWYFLSGAEVFGPKRTEAVAVVGDSLTDGRGSTTNGNDRWPDHLRIPDVAVLNQAAGGNRVLADGLGPNLLSRVDRDVLAQSGVSWLVVFEGVNDIGTAAATPEAQRQVAADLIDAYDQIVVRAQAHGIRVYGATLTPFGGNTGYDDLAGTRESARQAVNTWIRTSGRFDAVLDFDRVARDPGFPARLSPAYDVGDHLHLGPAGYRALADSVPARLFRR
ncbi:SGNH/GDSL hydrolase family protein [Amycolatopsis sp. lyj-112]|uniref:SGNH/GDSL hydrolase family protein n=1 Tax=Amycolatopsis sp. lyj-112 TaxID=2789288 RepID=UPI00397ADAE2